MTSRSGLAYMKLKHLNDVSSCACVIEETIFHLLWGDVNGKSVSGIIRCLGSAGGMVNAAWKSAKRLQPYRCGYMKDSRFSSGGSKTAVLPTSLEPSMRTAVRLLTIACSLALGAHAFAAPPEGKGKPDKSGQGQGQGQGQGKNKGQGQGDSGDKNGKSNSGNGNGKGNGKGNGGDGSLRQAGISVTTARGYATEYHVTGYAPLPPGIRKNLARGKPLPPGIAKKMVPGPMLARLPVYPGYEWRVAGSDLVLVAIATAVVADILVNVFD